MCKSMLYWRYSRILSSILSVSGPRSYGTENGGVRPRDHSDISYAVFCLKKKKNDATKAARDTRLSMGWPRTATSASGIVSSGARLGGSRNLRYFRPCGQAEA